MTDTAGEALLRVLRGEDLTIIEDSAVQANVVFAELAELIRHAQTLEVQAGYRRVKTTCSCHATPHGSVRVMG